jgi:hypothetical protein
MMGEYFWIRFALLTTFYIGSISTPLNKSEEKSIIEFTEAKTKGTTISYALYSVLLLG